MNDLKHNLTCCKIYKKLQILICIGALLYLGHSNALGVSPEYPFSKNFQIIDSLPTVITRNRAELIDIKLKHAAAVKYGLNQLPDNLKEWETYRVKLKNEIIEKTGVKIDHKLSLNIKESGNIQMKGYSIKKITFQTIPEVYVTANLYVPDGKGPFPAVMNLLHLWHKGVLNEIGPQAVGHTLAQNGFVCLTMDPWGIGERSTDQFIAEHHGNNLGSSILNIGETLMGIQIIEDMRGVDLLCSLPYVDSQKIGATGASGGGNQTMWLAALDERVKAAVPVCSVGTFESYIMRPNCACELLVDGLTFTEESGVLALIAPRALKICNHLKEAHLPFLPKEMLRSYYNIKPVYKMLGAENNLTYQLIDLPHGYYPEDREAMVGWFELHLKGIGSGTPKKEIPFELVPEEKLSVFSTGQRDPGVLSTQEYCKQRGNELRNILINTKIFDVENKKKELAEILRINEKSDLKEVHKYSGKSGWSRFVLETSDEKLIPVLIRTPSGNSREYVIISDADGKQNISLELVDGLIKTGFGIAVVDLSGTGEAFKKPSRTEHAGVTLYDMSRSEIWLGKTVIGEWVKELGLVTRFLNSTFNADKIIIDGRKEAGLAALFLSVTEGKVDKIILRDAPISYLFDSYKIHPMGSVANEFFSLGIHLPGFLKWGDVSLAAALSGKIITFINPVTMSGQKISESKLKEYQTEFDKIRVICKQQGKTLFN